MKYQQKLIMLKKEKLADLHCVVLMVPFSFYMPTLRKSASVPNYTLLIVELYSSKVYVYPMHSRKNILQKLEQFYGDVQSKRKNQTLNCR